MYPNLNLFYFILFSIFSIVLATNKWNSTEFKQNIAKFGQFLVDAHQKLFDEVIIFLYVFFGKYTLILIIFIFVSIGKDL